MKGARHNLASSSMYAGERDIMDRWDAGEDVLAIATALEKDPTYVRQVVGQYHVTSANPQDAMVRHGTAQLLAAIARHHPEMVAGALA